MDESKKEQWCTGPMAEDRGAPGGVGGSAEPGKGPPRQDDRLGRGTVCLGFPPSVISNKCPGLDSKPWVP